MVNNERLAFMEEKMAYLVGYCEPLAPFTCPRINTYYNSFSIAENEARLRALKMVASNLGAFAYGDLLHGNGNFGDRVFIKKFAGFLLRWQHINS